MESPLSQRTNPPLWQAAGVALVVFILLLSRALTRPLDLDEHQFLAPALLLNAEGLRPYVDYPLFHMPQLVWVYAAIIKPFSDPLLVVRVFSALVGTCCVMLVFGAGYRWPRGMETCQRWTVGLAVAALYLGARVFTYTNGWAWNHDASILAALGAVLLQLHAMRTGRVEWFLLVGLLLGTSFTIRLTTLPVVGAMGSAVLVVPSGLSWLKRLVACALAVAGMAVAAWPTYMLYRAAPEAFWFGNFRYPELYRLYVLSNDPHHTTFIAKIGHFFQTWFGDPGNIAVILLVAAALWRAVRGGYWRGRAGGPVATLGLVLVGLWFGLSAPFQMQMQYHAVLLPFFLLLIVLVVDSERFDPAAARKWMFCLAGAAVVVLAVQFPRWYWYVAKLPTPTAWTPMQVKQTGAMLHKLVPAEGRILTLDPIVALEAGLKVYPEFATGRFIEHVGKFMTEAERERFGMLWGEALEKRLAKEPPAAIMYHAGLEDKAGDFVAYATGHGFVKHTISAGGVDVQVKAGEKAADMTYVVWVAGK